MDEGARMLRKIDSIEVIVFETPAEFILNLPRLQYFRMWFCCNFVICI